MILVHFTPTGGKRVADLQGIFQDATALLVGGAPSLKDQCINRLTERGVLTMAMNNAALHFRPNLWVSGDNPNCYDPQILKDPGIMKFAPMAQADVEIFDAPYYRLPNLFFYLQEPNTPWEDYLAPGPAVPWYGNTLFSAIYALYTFGIRRIILAGSDFGFGADSAYAHDANLSEDERTWNMYLYDHQVEQLRLLQPLFDNCGLTLMDCSKHSRLKGCYPHVSMDEAIELCQEDLPAPQNPAELPHCSVYASRSIEQYLQDWPELDTIQSETLEK